MKTHFVMLSGQTLANFQYIPAILMNGLSLFSEYFEMVTKVVIWVTTKNALPSSNGN